MWPQDTTSAPTDLMNGVHSAHTARVQVEEVPAPPRVAGERASGEGTWPSAQEQRRRPTIWPGAIDVIFEKDPAACNIFEVLTYQGLHAILFHRVAHALYRLHVPVLPRLFS